MALHVQQMQMIPICQLPHNEAIRNNIIPLLPSCPRQATFQLPQNPFPSPPARIIPFGLRIVVPNNIYVPRFASQVISDSQDEKEFAVDHKLKFHPKRDQVSCTIHTLPVNPKLIGDGDGMTVHVDMSYALEIHALPSEIHNTIIARLRAKAARDYQTADYLQELLGKTGYRLLRGAWKGEILTKEYRIRLKGIDAPEMGMTYGEEAKEALIRLIGGRSLQLNVYGKDPYGRLLADVYIGGHFIQEILLKEGHVWHYRFFDTRPELAQWQFEAQAYKKGLWADPNPQSPWDYKRQERSKKMMFQDATN